MRSIMRRIATAAALTAAAVTVPSAAHADVIGGDVNVNVFAPVTVLIKDVLNGLLVHVL